jgi:hypothetical protein
LAEKERAPLVGAALPRIPILEIQWLPGPSTARMTSAAVVARKGVFAAGFMRSVSYVALSITRLIALEVIELTRSPLREGSAVAIVWVVPVVYVPVESALTVEPWSRAEKYSPHKPIGAVIAVGRAFIRRVVEITVWANRGNSDTNRNLGLASGGTR